MIPGCLPDEKDQSHPMWLYVASLIGLYYLFRWYREKQVVSNLEDKYVFITGCDSGFGNQLAKQLDLRGLRVLAACLTEKGAEQLRHQTSDRVKTVILDVTKTESITAAAQWVKECVGNKGLWGLVNNAGIVLPHICTEMMTKEILTKTLNVNLIGLIEVTLNMLPMIRQARGRIVNVCSILGRMAAFSTAYCSSKFGVEAFSDCLRLEMQYFGVKVCIIEPGYFKTNLTNEETFVENFKKSWNDCSVEIKESYGQEFFEKSTTVLLDSAHFFNELNPTLNFIKVIMKRCCRNLNLVTDCMEHALTCSYPRYRYSAGWDAQFLYIPMSYLPTRLLDYLLSKNLQKPAHAI